METVAYIIGLALTGLIVGALARLGLPGRDPMSIFQTMLVGIAGSLIAGLISYYAFDSERGAGILLSVLCALAIVFAVRKVRERQLGEHASSARGPAAIGGSGVQMSFMPGCLITSLLVSVVLTVLLNLLLRAF
jgi:uncharacterized membrane protein YeaQ/YmgE (transglycosylase-associated protein family)